MAQPDILKELRHFYIEARTQAERSMEQLTDEQFFQTLDNEANSVALVLKHVSGNLRSRWTDFLSSDGEKSDRHRDSEFIIESADSRASLMDRWNRSWKVTLDTLDSLTIDDLGRTIYIRTKPWQVLSAILRNLTHTVHHVGQIVLLSKHLKGADWQTLSIPRGQSETFNREMKSSKS